MSQQRTNKGQKHIWNKQESRESLVVKGFSRFLMSSHHYNNCVMQANQKTLSTLKENTRLVMGGAVYAVRGLSDYIREFTEDGDSVRLLYFSLYFQQPTERDDLELGIADGKAFSWTITVDGPRSLRLGKTAQFSATSLRCGETPNRNVSYRWESLSDILEVTEKGVVTALAEGTGTLRCSLEQNPDIFTDLIVEAAVEGLSWATSLPERLVCYRAVTLTVDSDKTVTWSFAGPPENFYQAQEAGNAVILTAYYPSNIPLTVTASDGDTALTVNLILSVR